MKKNPLFAASIILLLSVSACVENTSGNETLPYYPPQESPGLGMESHSPAPLPTLLPDGGEFIFTGFGEARELIVEYGNNRAFNYGLSEAVDGVIYQINMYRSSAGNDGKLYMLSGGMEELLVDAEVRNLIYHDGKLYYIKKKSEDIYPGSVSVIGNIYALDIATNEEQLVLEGNIRAFRLTDKGMYYMTPDGLFLADNERNTVAHFSDKPSGSFYLYAQYALLVDAEKEKWYFLNTENGTKTYTDYAPHCMWEDALFYSDDSGGFFELNLVTGEEKAYSSDAKINRNALYMTYVNGDIYVTDMRGLYRLDREKLRLIPMAYESTGTNYWYLSLNDLFSDGKTLYAPCSYSLAENGATVYNIAAFDITNSGAAVLSMLLT